MGAQQQHKGMFLKHGVRGGQKFSNSVMRGVIFFPRIHEGGGFFFRLSILNPPPAINNERSLKAVFLYCYLIVKGPSQMLFMWARQLTGNLGSSKEIQLSWLCS